VILEEDTEPRVVAVPPDLGAALAADPAAGAFYRQLSYTRQREYVQWLTAAKREETRRSRIARIVEMLRAGRRER